MIVGRQHGDLDSGAMNSCEWQPVAFVSLLEASGAIRTSYSPRWGSAHSNHALGCVQLSVLRGGGGIMRILVRRRARVLPGGTRGAVRCGSRNGQKTRKSSTQVLSINQFSLLKRIQRPLTDSSPFEAWTERIRRTVWHNLWSEYYK